MRKPNAGMILIVPHLFYLVNLSSLFNGINTPLRVQVEVELRDKTLTFSTYSVLKFLKN